MIFIDNRDILGLINGVPKINLIAEYNNISRATWLNERETRHTNGCANSVIAKKFMNII